MAKTTTQPWSHLALLVLLGCLLFAGAAEAQDEIFVPNTSTDSVTVYSRDASGNAAPLRTLQVPATGSFDLSGLAVNLISNELFVLNRRSVSVFSRTASGNAAPNRVLAGAATGISNGHALALDLAHNELFVLNAGLGSSIVVHSLTASGNTAPLRTLQGPATGLDLPAALLVDPTNNEVFVGNDGSNTITVYNRTASGNTAPLRTLQGAEISSPEHLALDPLRNELFVANNGFISVDVYPRTANGSATPLRRLQGAATGLNNVAAVAVDFANDELFVVNATPTGSVTVYSRTASGNTAPLRALRGAATGLSHPIGISLTPKLDLLVAVNSPTFHTADTMLQTVGISNPGLPGTMDLYLGNLWPNGTIQFFTRAGLAFGSVSTLASFQPIVTNVLLTTTFSAVVPGFFAYTWTGPELTGDFVLFFLALTAGALSDGVITPAEVLGIAVAPYTFTPRSP